MKVRSWAGLGVISVRASMLRVVEVGVSGAEVRGWAVMGVLSVRCDVEGGSGGCWWCWEGFGLL